jgi:hypothetical protein
MKEVFVHWYKRLLSFEGSLVPGTPGGAALAVLWRNLLAYLIFGFWI